MGYHIRFDILNAADYGIPQTRRRLFVVGYKKNVDLPFPPKRKELQFKLKDFSINSCDFGHFTYGKNGDLIVPKVSGIIDKNS